MSHSVDIALQLTDKDAIVASLVRLGWTRDQIEVHEQAVPFYNYNGSQNMGKANIIVRRQHVGYLSNELAFTKQSDGTYKMSVDNRTNGWTEDWSDRLCTYYGVEKLKTEYTKKGYKFEESLDEKKRIKLRAFVPNFN